MGNSVDYTNQPGTSQVSTLPPTILDQAHLFRSRALNGGAPSSDLGNQRDLPLLGVGSVFSEQKSA